MGNSLLVTGNSLLVFTTPPCGHPSNGGELNTYHCGLNSPLWRGTYSATGRKPSSPMRRGAGISGPTKMIIFVGDRPAGRSSRRQHTNAHRPGGRNTSNKLQVTSNRDDNGDKVSKSRTLLPPRASPTPPMEGNLFRNVNRTNAHRPRAPRKQSLRGWNLGGGWGITSYQLRVTSN